jgi:hypothetical protein
MARASDGAMVAGVPAYTAGKLIGMAVTVIGWRTLAVTVLCAVRLCLEEDGSRATTMIASA